MRALLIVLILLFATASLFRLFVAGGPARRARKGPFLLGVQPAQGVPVHGVPVASAPGIAQGEPVP